MRAGLLRVLAASAVLGTALVTAWAGPAATQDAGGTFSGTAVADGVRVNVAIPSYLLVEDFVDGGGPSAQAVLDSLGVSRAFASFPYPGEVGVSATGLVSTLSGLSLPSYPFVAASDHPVQPERNIDQPGFHLNASSDESASIGDARFGETTSGGALEGGGFSRASVTRDDDGTVVARAEARYSLVLGPVAIRGVRSVAQVARTADGKVEPTSSLEVTGLSIGGVDLVLTPRGLVLAGAPIVPIDVVTGVTQALTLGETTIRVLPETITGDTVMSAGLEIATSVDLPAVGHPLNVSYRLGNVLARASSTAFAPDELPSLPLPDDAIPGFDLGVAPSFGGPVAAGAGSPTGPALGDQVTVRRIGNPVRVSAWTFFPILALAGLALVAGALGERWQHTRDSTRGDP